LLFAQEITAPLQPTDDVKFLAFDRPGYGPTDPLDQGNGPASQARWLAEVLDALGEKNCIVVAHSLRTSMVLWLAVRRSDLVSRLLLLAPFCRPTRKSGAALLHAAVQPGIGPIINECLFLIDALLTGRSFLSSALFKTSRSLMLAASEHSEQWL